MTLEEQAADFIAEWEGFSAHAYWDVNHWRVGYGSDTEGPKEIPVVRETVTTVSRSKQNLVLRIGAFKTKLISEIGPIAFSQCNQNQQVALIDMVYNYGHLPFKWVRDEQVVATLILQRGNDNNGINLSRRRAESSLYLTVIATASEARQEAIQDKKVIPAVITVHPNPQSKAEPMAQVGENPTVKEIVDALETLDTVLQNVLPAVSVFIPAPIGVPLHVVANLIHGLAKQLEPYA